MAIAPKASTLASLILLPVLSYTIVLQLVKMTVMSAKWSRIAASQRLDRSSQAVSVVGQKTYIFGGELVPREPVDNKVDVVEISDESGKEL